MKRGSRARHCKKCRKIVFWTVPTELLGTERLGFIQVGEIKKVRPYKYDAKTMGYYCTECFPEDKPLT